MKAWNKRTPAESLFAHGDSHERVVRLRRFGFRPFALPRPRLSVERGRQPLGPRLSAE